MPMLRRALAGFAALGAVLGAGPALAWSNLGHQTTGAIAWQDLKRNHPAELAELLVLIRQHPDYRLMAPTIAALPADQQERALFETLARWPDDIRGGPEDRPDWHFQLRVVYGRTWLWPFQNGNAAFGFGYNYTKLANPCATAAERAKSIGWLIHIIGDVQQPLHAGHQMTSTYSLTDRAGQLAWVKRPNGVAHDLHQYWDMALDDSGAVLPAGYPTWAEALAAEWPRARFSRELASDETPQVVFNGYLDESAGLAAKVAYTGSYLLAVPDQTAAPAVSQAEQDKATALAKQRIAIGGYRIADMLVRAVTEARTASWTCPA